MSDYLPQSTDRVSTDTSAKSSNIIINDSTTVTFAATGSIYQATATIQLPIDTTYTINSYEAYVALDFGAGSILYYQLGYSQLSTAGVWKRSAYSNVSLDVKPYAYVLNLVLQEASPLVPASTATVYYLVKSTKLNG